MLVSTLQKIVLYFIMCSPISLQKGGSSDFENFKKGGTWKNFGVGETNTKRDFQKERGDGTQLFMLNLGIEKDKNWDF